MLPGRVRRNEIRENRPEYGLDLIKVVEERGDEIARRYVGIGC